MKIEMGNLENIKKEINEQDRLDAVERKVREIKDVAIGTTQNKAQKEKKTEKSDLGNNIELSNMHVIGVLEGKEKGRKIEKYDRRDNWTSSMCLGYKHLERTLLQP